MATLQWASVERGRAARLEGRDSHRATRGGIAVRARPSAPTTHYFLLPTLSSLLMPVLYPVYTLQQKTMHHRA